ncbi:BRO family, N- domain protein [Vibrio cholerae]|nr:BRO family, N- domain protein [Vibrio cholerae]
MTSALTFQNTHFDVIEQHNQLWLSAAQIGKALGYAREDSVSRIYDRNQDEFSSGMSMTVNLTVNGINNSLRQKSVRIFSLRGAHLIAMFARTAIAKQFRGIRKTVCT